MTSRTTSNQTEITTQPQAQTAENVDTVAHSELDPNPRSLNCCQNLHHGLMNHLRGSKHWHKAKAYYECATQCDRFPASRFLDWINSKDRISFDNTCSSLTDHQKLTDAIDRHKRSKIDLEASDVRGLILASSLAAMREPAPTDHMWHSLRMLHDIVEAGGSYLSVKESVGRVGPMHNVLDENGIPVAGLLREVVPSEAAGWLDLDFIEFSSGDFKVSGTPSGRLVPLLTQADLDVAAQLAFFEGSEPVPPSFSLDKAPSERTDMRLDRKTFQPSWLASTAFGQSMYFADWLMKSFTMWNGLPSVEDPLVSGATVEDWQPPAIVKEVSKATGHRTLPDETAASHGRLEIVVRSADVSRACFKKWFFQRVIQYQLGSIDLFVESSIYGGDDDSQRSTLHFENDPATQPGARAKVILDNYQHISDLFPVFERVGLILAVFSIMCQARKDGVKLSSKTKRRISSRTNSFKANFDKMYPPCELSPKPFHNGGCYCSGGVSGRPQAAVTKDQTKPFTARSVLSNPFSGNGGKGGASQTGFASDNGNPSAKKEFNWNAIIPEWTTWSHYQKESMAGETYARIAGRYYSHHAVQGMNLPAYGYYAGDPKVDQDKYVGAKVNIETGHSIAPRYVENCIRNGESELQSNNRHKFIDGNIIVVTDISKRIVISVGYTA